MAFSTVYSCTLNGLAAREVVVETHISGGLPGMAIVGLPQSAVRESKDRVKAAILHAGLSFPIARITVNLAPADLPKQGGRFDLPIALGILVADGQLPAEALDRLVTIGELGLTGLIRPVSGVLPSALSLAGQARQLVLPCANLAEAAHSRRTQVVGVDALLSLVDALRARRTDQPLTGPSTSQTPQTSPSIVASNASGTAETVSDLTGSTATAEPDLADVRGQAHARRALEIAAAGGHHLLFSGPPGTGKTLLARRLPGLLPPLADDEALQTAALASISLQGFDNASWGRRPFRAPHHSASGVALVGGGHRPMPGEISLAHNGVLFLDELPEFSPGVLDMLREPLECGEITLARAARRAIYPARFQLVAAMNPCPCGYLGDPETACRCRPVDIQRFQRRLSGPLLDRIDLQVAVPRLSADEWREAAAAESTAMVRERVLHARSHQRERQGCVNAMLPLSAVERQCRLDREADRLLRQVVSHWHLSMRAIGRLLRCARSIADLADDECVGSVHLAEAAAYRQDPGQPMP